MRSYYYLACFRPPCGVSLPLIVTQPDLHRPRCVRSYQLCGSLATAPRRQLAFTVALLSLDRLRRALILLCVARVKPHSGASLLFMAAQPSTRRLRPRAHLTNMAR